MDCICCGFGAVILIFVITTGRGLRQNEDFLTKASVEIIELEAEILAAQQILDQKKAALAEAELIARELEDNAQAAAILEAAIDEKSSQLENLDTELSGISVAVETTETPTKPEPVKQTQPKYLTEFSTNGKRILILLESSGGMLGNSVNEAQDYVQRPKSDRLLSPKWKRARMAVETILAYLPEKSLYQVYHFNADTQPLYQDGNKKWLNVTDPKARVQVLRALNELNPSGGANHEHAFKAAAKLGPDNIIVITDGLPTLSDTYATGGGVSETQRLIMMRAATATLPHGISVNILLFPMSEDLAAAPYFWRLALSHRGSMISPSKDWPR